MESKKFVFNYQNKHNLQQKNIKALKQIFSNKQEQLKQQQKETNQYPIQQNDVQEQQYQNDNKQQQNAKNQNKSQTHLLNKSISPLKKSCSQSIQLQLSDLKQGYNSLIDNSPLTKQQNQNNKTPSNYLSQINLYDQISNQDQFSFTKLSDQKEVEIQQNQNVKKLHQKSLSLHKNDNNQKLQFLAEQYIPRGKTKSFNEMNYLQMKNSNQEQISDKSPRKNTNFYSTFNSIQQKLEKIQNRSKSKIKPLLSGVSNSGYQDSQINSTQKFQIYENMFGRSFCYKNNAESTPKNLIQSNINRPQTQAQNQNQQYTQTNNNRSCSNFYQHFKQYNTNSNSNKSNKLQENLLKNLTNQKQQNQGQNFSQFQNYLQNVNFEGQNKLQQQKPYQMDINNLDQQKIINNENLKSTKNNTNNIEQKQKLNNIFQKKKSLDNKQKKNVLWKY
ncbi:hypothetical protein PPERSA_11331 [Pseudocohnilembus persalinus]|uniref:Uncharacterized protein n=1 Tax=Pseudocohnilembus persalinus TaxID=266149 RepID=A0A0V0QPC1_PSEPJ|nr:hypothetical protein PPERSA_11331 [Pseudocohnilembus persalinus]|eukprot:KRX04207.1 hypothetical protein PPERSA_11331 [Pseudocohnilembus persalinus]